MVLPSRLNQLTNDEFQELLDTSSSLKEILLKIGLKHSGNYAAINHKLSEGNYDLSQFNMNRKKVTLIRKSDDLFTINSPVHRGVIKRRILIENLIPYICTICGNDGEWECKKLVLQLEHKNGDNKDNRLENLEFLCPNCHSQTNTYAGKNKRTKTKIWKCQKCFCEISQNCIHCRQCMPPTSKQKFTTTYEELYDMVHDQKLPIIQIGKHFGVSDNAIRKRCKQLDISLIR